MKTLACPSCQSVFTPNIVNNRFTCPACETNYVMYQKPDGKWVAKVDVQTRNFQQPQYAPQPNITIYNQVAPQQPVGKFYDETLNKRRDTLQQGIMSYAKRGYRVISQTETSAQISKFKSFSWFWFIVLCICGFLPGMLYLLNFAVAKEKTIYLMVDEHNNLHDQNNNWFMKVIICCIFPPYAIWLLIQYVLKKSDAEMMKDGGKYILWVIFPPIPMFLASKWVLNWASEDESHTWAKYALIGFWILVAICVVVSIATGGTPTAS